MDDILPLIPDKSGEACSDIRPVLREVFRDVDYLPPLTAGPTRSKVVGEDGDGKLPSVKWINTYSSVCDELWEQEGELKHQYAKRLSKAPLPNIYKLYPQTQQSATPKWRKDRGIIQRKDLMPSIVQNAGRANTLWIQNILNRSSCEFAGLSVKGSPVNIPVSLLKSDENTLQSLSIGDLVEYSPPSPSPPPPPLPLQEYIIGVPPQLDFINFSVGQLHTQSIRLINVSKFEIRLSIKPPSRRELDVELCGSRGLTVTSGAAAELKIHFRPIDVRVLKDVLNVRVSVGKPLVVPIVCYMQPPLLDILVPNIMAPILSCTPGEPCEVNAKLCDVLELGAKLLGDVHCVRLLLRCDAKHAVFFLLAEDSWLSYSLDGITNRGSLVAGPFVMWPAWWAGGGAVRARAWCIAPYAGLHSIPLRVLSSTAVVRPLHLLADSLYFRPEHLSLEAQDKDYDICSEDDPACEYYINLGIAFPGRSLSGTVQLVNHSPVLYSYYWSIRPWGVCSCWEKDMVSEGLYGSEDDSEYLCVGAKEARDKDDSSDTKEMNVTQLVRVEPARGQLAPRSSCAVHVRVPTVPKTPRRTPYRAVLMLVLKDIPKESFPPNYDPMIVNTTTVETEPIPGMKSRSRDVCEVVCLQLEVWWEVVPVRFVLDPPVLPLFHSRRLSSIDIKMRATQLYGCEGIKYTWIVPENASPLHPGRLNPINSNAVTLKLPLPVTPNEYPEIDVVTMVAVDQEWRSECQIIRQCTTRHPSLRPASVWLGIVPPKSHMKAEITVHNDTYQHICWWAEGFRWWGENSPRPVCIGQVPCEFCQGKPCTCAMVKPARGALAHGESHRICYDVNAPSVAGGCVATLINTKRTSPDVARIPTSAATSARASLIAYRVLAPRLILRLLPCSDQNKCHNGNCALDPSMAKSKRGTAILRPLRALVLSRRTCYRMRITNITPLPTTVVWHPDLEGSKVLKVIFIPSELYIGPHEQVEIRVILDPRKVCGRRIFVYKADVYSAYSPMYLVIDAAIAGLELTCEIPLGCDDKTDSFVLIRRTQREMFPWDANKQPSTADEIFEEDDTRRRQQKESVCRCRSKMTYIPPVKRPRPPPTGPEDYPSVELLWEAPPLTRVCPCDHCHMDPLPDGPGPFCLQFKNIPLRTVRSKTLVLRNESVLASRWSATVRKWPREHTRTLAEDQWIGDVVPPGLIIQTTPSSGVLPPSGRVDIQVKVYADCWGLYYDQIVLQIDKVEPIIVDMWMEATGPPLQFAFQPSEVGDKLPTLWFSTPDPERVLRVKNISLSALHVHAYIATANSAERLQDALPFRLYLRFFNVLPKTCPCVTAVETDPLKYGEPSEDRSSSYVEEMDTGIDIFLGLDYGVQEQNNFKVSPEELTVNAGEVVEWTIKLDAPPHNQLAAAANLLLRLQPVNNYGLGWYRPEPPPQVVRLEQAPREGKLKVSRKEVLVKLCALDLPYRDLLRIRKFFRVQNVGSGVLDVSAYTRPPWCMIQDDRGNGCACVPYNNIQRDYSLDLHILPRTSLDLGVELSIRTVDVWPVIPDSLGLKPEYSEWRTFTNPMLFYDADNILLTVPLILELEYPILKLEPECLDFGFITDGDTRKTYFSVSHTSKTQTLDMIVDFEGGPEFKLWPLNLTVRPGASERVYVQYTAIWCGGPVEGTARVRVSSGAGAWCRAGLACRAAPARDHKCHVTPHDHTDDTHLLPSDIVR